MEVPGISQSTLAGPSPTNGTEALSQLGEDYTTFLRLLTAQISNQDPLEPIDSTTFVTQLAQLTQVEQAAQTNKNLANLSAQIDGLALMAGASILGQQANVRSNQLVLTENGAMASYSVASTAVEVRAEIYGPAGQLLQTIEGLPGQAGTEHDFFWDGRTSSNQQALLGTYVVKFDAIDARGAFVPTEMYRDARIEAVDMSSGELSYLVDGDESIPPNYVRTIR